MIGRQLHIEYRDKRPTAASMRTVQSLAVLFRQLECVR